MLGSRERPQWGRLWTGSYDSTLCAPLAAATGSRAATSRKVLAVRAYLLAPMYHSVAIVAMATSVVRTISVLLPFFLAKVISASKKASMGDTI